MRTSMSAPGTGARNLIRIVVVTAAILLVPLVAMQFTNEVNWGVGDFITAAGLLIGAGLAYELAARRVQNPRQRVFVAIGVTGVLLLVWAELAVGIFH
jgi:uncharacterized membrane protein YfcA